MEEEMKIAKTITNKKTKTPIGDRAKGHRPPSSSTQLVHPASVSL